MTPSKPESVVSAFVTEFARSICRRGFAWMSKCNYVWIIARLFALPRLAQLCYCAWFRVCLYICSRVCFRMRVGICFRLCFHICFRVCFRVFDVAFAYAFAFAFAFVFACAFTFALEFRICFWICFIFDAWPVAIVSFQICFCFICVGWNSSLLVQMRPINQIQQNPLIEARTNGGHSAATKTKPSQYSGIGQYYWPKRFSISNSIFSNHANM